MAVAIVTGSRTGIGRETAVAFAKTGYTVYASMRDVNLGYEFLGAAREEGLDLKLLSMDVESEASVENAISSVIEAEGRIDLLVNNAGVANGGAIEDVSDDIVRLVFDVNTLGPLRVIRATLPVMRSQHSGTIVNVTSVGGRISVGFSGVYCGSKAALEAASESLAAEVYPFGIRVLIVEPGACDTALLRTGAEMLHGYPDSAYVNGLRKTSAVVDEMVATAADPSLVASMILRAVHDQSPRLRYLVGADAEAAVSARRAISDEQAVFGDGLVVFQHS